MEETKLTVLEDRFDDTPTMFATSGQLQVGDIGGPFVWEEDGKPVLGGIYTRDITLRDNTVRPAFICVFDFKDWIEDQIDKGS